MKCWERLTFVLWACLDCSNRPSEHQSRSHKSGSRLSVDGERKLRSSDAPSPHGQIQSRMPVPALIQINFAFLRVSRLLRPGSTVSPAHARLTGALASAAMLAAYLAIVSALSGSGFALSQFSEFWPYLFALSVGFGRAIPAKLWKGDPPGGHHRKGVLQFPVPSNSHSAVELRVQGGWRVRSQD